MLKYESVQELVEKSMESGQSISKLVLEDQAAQLDRPGVELYKEMECNFDVMNEAVNNGVRSSIKSPSGLSGGAGLKMMESVQSGNSISGKILGETLARALAVAEVNACMGRIVAAPTAGSCGIIPSVLITIQKERSIPRRKAVMCLFTAAAIGMVIAKQASISGAEGGCQAECGSASAMAAAALVEMVGGTPAMSANACAIALKNSLGLVCDPVAGLVEVPCVKRNAMGAANALVAADLALAGIESAIPADEVISAMKSIGDIMPSSLKETACGGLASTPTGIRLAEEIFGKR